MYMIFEVDIDEIRKDLKSDILKADELLRYTRYFVSKAKGYVTAIKFTKKFSLEAEKAYSDWRKITIYLAGFNSKFKDTELDGVKNANSLFIKKFQDFIIYENKYCGFFKKDYYLMAFLLSEYQKYLNSIFVCYEDLECEFNELRKIIYFLKQHNVLEIDELVLLIKNVSNWLGTFKENVREIKRALCCCRFSEKLYKSLISDLSSVFSYFKISYENANPPNLPCGWHWKELSVPAANFTEATKDLDAIAIQCKTYNETSRVMVGMILKILLMTYVFSKYNKKIWNNHIFYEDQEKFEIREQSKNAIKEICKKMNIYVPGVNRVQGIIIYGV